MMALFEVSLLFYQMAIGSAVNRNKSITNSSTRHLKGTQKALF